MEGHSETTSSVCAIVRKCSKLGENGCIRRDMSGVLDMPGPVAPAKTRLTDVYEFPADTIHETVHHCGKYTDLSNRMLEEVWPLLRAEIYNDFLFRKVPTPIVAMDRLVHPTPWDWDIQACERCGKMVGTPVLKKRHAWLGDKYCVECERILLGGAN